MPQLMPLNWLMFIMGFVVIIMMIFMYSNISNYKLAISFVDMNGNNLKWWW